MTRHFIIDCDPGSDDVIALLMALRAPDVTIDLITTVSGNVPVTMGTLNTLHTLALFGADVPVYVGADRPLVREPEYAFFYHGADGLGGQHLPAPRRQPEAAHASDALIAGIRANPGLTLVTLGPLTNLALAIARAPEIVADVGRCVMMGGTAGSGGNVTPAAEFNIWADPEAAQRVFTSGLLLEMVGWELCRGEAAINAAEIEQLRALDTPLAHFVLASNRTAIAYSQHEYGEPSMALADPVAMAIALDPVICTHSSAEHVLVETQSALTRGMTVIDALNVGGEERNLPVWGSLVAGAPNVTVCWEIDIPRWKAMCFDALA
ncbi:MAG: nucleoside hydrolase [Anaerolineae bacterium]|nr:nucleoside hydrolase [Anaerolineae bacterium]